MGDMVQYKTAQILADLSHSGAWRKLLTITAWGSGPPKLDLRSWQQAGDQLVPGRGVTLTREEAQSLFEALYAYLDECERIDANGGQHDT